jgi:hypothetical protein
MFSAVFLNSLLSNSSPNRIQFKAPREFADGSAPSCSKQINLQLDTTNQERFTLL